MANERWLVLTGARSPLGRAIAQGWWAEGGRVLAVSRDPETRLGDVTVRADLSRPADLWPAATDWLDLMDGPPTAFVHAAGLVYASPSVDTTRDEWRQMLTVNLEAGWVLARDLRRAMTHGAMVMVSSVDVQHSAAAGPAAAYGAAKAALEALTRHWAVEWGPSGLRVNAVRLGPLAAGMPITPSEQTRLRAETADGRLTTPDEAAAVVLWLLSGQAAAVTGQVIPVDHGFHLRY